MDVAKIIRCTGVAVALTFALAVSSAFADGIGSRGYEGSMIKSDVEVTHFSSTPSTGGKFDYFADLRFSADLDSDSFRLNKGDWRGDGIRDGQWMKLSLFKDADNAGGPSVPNVSGGDNTVPEPGTFLLLANGMGGALLFVRRRLRKA